MTNAGIRPTTVLDLFRTFIGKAARSPLSALRNPIMYHRVAEYSVAMQHLDPRPGEKVMDVGCNYRVFPVWLLARGADVTGIDLDPEPLKLYGNLPFVHARRDRFRAMRADIVDCAEAAAGFHAITAISVIEHIPDAAGAMQAMARLLRPGGRAVLTFPVSSCKIVYHNPYTLSYTERMIHEELAEPSGLRVEALECWITMRMRVERTWLDLFRAPREFRRAAGFAELDRITHWQNFGVLKLRKRS